MGSVHEEVGLSWKGKEYTVPADQVMGLVEVVEDIITIEELAGSGVKRVKLSRAFAAALRYAGAAVDQEEVYQELFGGEAMASTTQVIHALLALMIPPEHLRTTPTPAAPGKAKPAPKARGRSKASKRPT